MPGDFSRRTFNPQKRYAGVEAQQGRVLTDADVNEQLDIGQHRTQTEAIDAIGRCGVPKTVGGFRIDKTPDGGDLLISPGRAYVEGVLCELDASPAGLSFPQGASAVQAAVGSLIVDDRPLEIGHWVEISADNGPKKVIRITGVTAQTRLLSFDTNIAQYRLLPNPVIRRITTYLTQPDYPDPALAGPSVSPPGFEAVVLDEGTYLVYLKAWQREVNALTDPHIKEVALAGPDTATRLKNVWQVNLWKVTPPPASKPDCATPFPTWTEEIAAGTGRMNARAVSTAGAAKPCLVPATSGFRRLENQLYRVEVHSGGPRAQATFKWSRENASVETRIKVSGSTIIADDLGKDEGLGFKGGDWAEILDDASELKGVPHPLIQLNPPDPATREITTGASISTFSNQPALTLRRWDQTGAGATNAGVKITAGWMDLEDGLQVSFSEGTYRSGDYWLIPARTGTGDVEWPPFDVPNINPIPQSPLGIKRHYCRLALLTVAKFGAITEIQDCRNLFPPLTALTAADVSYNPSNCKTLVGVKNVQQALDGLCSGSAGPCTFVATPGGNIQALFDAIASGGDAEICFPVGTYTLPATVVVKNKGQLKVSGVGPGTRLVAASAESALRFENCLSVTVRDLAAETGITGAATQETTDLNGTLTFDNCGDVDVANVHLMCAGGPVRAGTCVTMRSATSVRSARVSDCRLRVGHLQSGVLLVNAGRAEVRGNVIDPAPKQPLLQVAALLQDAGYRAMLRARLIGKPVLGVTPPPGGVANAKIQFGQHTIHFATPPLLKNDWQPLLNAKPPAGNVATLTPTALLKHLKTLADQVLTEPAVRNTSVRFVQWFTDLVQTDEAIAYQGIVVGGSQAGDVRVADNTISGVLQAVHIGVSHRVPVVNQQPDVAGTISVTGNTAEVVLPQDARRRDRHGLFVGNCTSLMVENNHLRLRRLTGTQDIPIEGMRLYGFMGRKVIVRHNHVVGFPIGVTVTPRFPYPALSTVAWLVADNMFETVQTPVNLPKAPHAGAPVTEQGNKGFP